MLPPTETITVNVEFSTAEREFYNSLLEKSQSVFEGFIKSGTASKSWMAIFSLLNRLRQTCDHVALTVKSHLDDDEWNPASLEMSSPSKSTDKSPKRTPKKHSNDKDALGQAVRREEVRFVSIEACVKHVY
jgi:SNF2 family DNA or RNA helicase